MTEPKGAPCGNCRKSSTVKTGKVWMLVCKSGMDTGVRSCAGFHDARKPCFDYSRVNG